MITIPVSAKKTTAGIYRAIYGDSSFRPQNTGRNAYCAIALAIKAVVFFADTGKTNPKAVSGVRFELQNVRYGQLRCIHLTHIYIYIYIYTCAGNGEIIKYIFLTYLYAYAHIYIYTYTYTFT